MKQLSLFDPADNPAITAADLLGWCDEVIIPDDYRLIKAASPNLPSHFAPDDGMIYIGGMSGNELREMYPWVDWAMAEQEIWLE